MDSYRERINEQMDLEPKFNPVPFFRFLLRKLWLIALVAVVFAVAAFGVTKLTIDPTYRSSFTAYVNNQQSQAVKDTLTNSDILASHNLVETYAAILKSNSVLMAAANYTDKEYTYAQLKSMVATETVENTEIITVSVIASSPEEALDVAEAIAKVAPSHIKDIVEGSSMKLIDYPELPKYRHGPSYVLAALISVFISVVVTLIILVIRFIKDDTVISETELEERFSYPLLGVIPDIVAANQEGNAYGKGYHYGEGAKKNG